MSSLQLPEPIKVSKNLAHELDVLEQKGETIVTICGYSNIESLFLLNVGCECHFVTHLFCHNNLN